MVSHVNEKGTLHDVFIEDVYASIIHRLRTNWATNQQAEIGDNWFPAESLLSFQKSSGNHSGNKYLNTNQERLYTRILWSNRNVAFKVDTEAMSTLPRRTQHRSTSGHVLRIKALGIPSSKKSSAHSPSSSNPSGNPLFYWAYYNTSHPCPEISASQKEYFWAASDNLLKEYEEIFSPQRQNAQITFTWSEITVIIIVNVKVLGCRTELSAFLKQRKLPSLASAWIN